MDLALKLTRLAHSFFFFFFFFLQPLEDFGPRGALAPGVSSLRWGGWGEEKKRRRKKKRRCCWSSSVFPPPHLLAQKLICFYYCTMQSTLGQDPSRVWRPRLGQTILLLLLLLLLLKMPFYPSGLKKRHSKRFSTLRRSG